VKTTWFVPKAFGFVQEILVVIRAKFDKVKDEVNSNLTVVSEIYMIFITKTLFPKKRKGERPFFFMLEREKNLML
jgi:hypothetical protein